MQIITTVQNGGGGESLERGEAQQEEVWVFLFPHYNGRKIFPLSNVDIAETAESLTVYEEARQG